MSASTPLSLRPLAFIPVYQERPWGGRRLAERFGRTLPPGRLIGESWELSDRPEGATRMRGGPWPGQALEILRDADRAEAWLGSRFRGARRFPLLVKLLDARQTLSVQVHPPAARAAELGGAPKTEFWHFLDCAPDAHLIAGFARPTTRAELERAIAEGTLPDLLHRIDVRPGDSMFLPSGRVHALGAGAVLLEVQQNSDTTYRLYDWGRVGLDGRPRELHVGQGLASVDYNDVRPALVTPRPLSGLDRTELLAECPAFSVRRILLEGASTRTTDPERFALLIALGSPIRLVWQDGEELLAPAELRLLPARLGAFSIAPAATASADALLVLPEP